MNPPGEDEGLSGQPGVVGDVPCTGGNNVGCENNCQSVPDPDQIDTDGDRIGNDCDHDKTADGFPNQMDN
ncbi:MAG: hypothetical protein ACE5EQ_09645 [Phycisphaerae bacterium]